MATELNRHVSSLSRTEELLGEDGRALLEFNSPKIPKDALQMPGPDFIDRVWADSGRSPRALRSLQNFYDHGGLAGNGYLPVLPVDQGIEHSAGASFAPNPAYFDPENIVRLAIGGGCDALSAFDTHGGRLGRAHKTPFVVRVNHNEVLARPNKFDQVLFGTVEQAGPAGEAGAAQGVSGSDALSARRAWLAENFDTLRAQLRRRFLQGEAHAEGDPETPGAEGSRPPGREPSAPDPEMDRKYVRWRHVREKILFFVGLTLFSAWFVVSLIVVYSSNAPAPVRAGAATVLSCIALKLLRELTR